MLNILDGELGKGFGLKNEGLPFPTILIYPIFKDVNLPSIAPFLPLVGWFSLG
jgi:hypothetical protein